MKQWTKAFTENLKEGNDLLAAEFALALGKTIPSHGFQHDLTIRVEKAQEKLTSEIV